MKLDHIPSDIVAPDRSPMENGLCRRTFLKTGAAVGGGLMLSLELVLPNNAATAGNSSGGFVPNALIRIGTDVRIVLTMPYVEIG
jgi:isoquinoline 1-oxidoreductase subunit beta